MALGGRPGPRRTPLAVAQLVALGVLGALVVVLAATGAYLWFRYRPTPTPEADPLVDRLRYVHRSASTAAVAVALVVLGLSVAVGRERRRGEPGRHAWAPALASAVLALAASFTGFLLPWDQLALWAPGPGGELRGVAVAFDDAVRFVLVGDAVYRRWAVVHSVVFPALAVVALGLVAWRSAAHPRRGAQPPVVPADRTPG